MNIILFSEQFGSNLTTLNPHPILPGIYRLATHLRSLGHTVKTLSLWKINKEEFSSILNHISKSQIDVVGISTTLLYNLPIVDSDVDDFVEKIKIIKNLLPLSKIVVGGSMVRSVYFSNLKDSFSLVDFFVKGQGESAFSAVLDHIENSKQLKTISIVPKVISDETYKFDNFNNSIVTYQKDDFINSTDALGVEYSRGCIFKCSFCNYPGIGKRVGEYIKTKQVLKDELLKNYELYGTKYYYFTDDLLNESVEKMEELAEISSQLPFDFKYSSYIRLDLIHKWPKMADLLRDSGMIAGHAGIETINDSSGKSVLKGLGKTRINETLDICKSSWNNKIGLAGSFMLGLPHDTEDTVHELVEWLSEELPSTTITDFNISALRLASEDMINNPKYKYTWEDNRITGWTNQFSYSFDQANKDADFALKKFYEKYEIPVRFSGFDLPQLIAYAESNKYNSMMMDFYLTRQRNDFIKSPHDWYKLRNTWHSNRRKIYIQEILKQ